VSPCMHLELEEGHTWHIACIYLVFLLFLELHLGGCTCGGDILLFVEVIAFSKP
jgi:hypothetical protein